MVSADRILAMFAFIVWTNLAPSLLGNHIQVYCGRSVYYLERKEERGEEKERVVILSWTLKVKKRLHTRRKDDDFFLCTVYIIFFFL